MKLLSTAVPKVTGKVFDRKYTMLGRLLTQWEEIIGSELAFKTQPVKLRYMKYKEGAKNSAGSNATLEIACTSADATILHYQKNLILERIIRIFGDDWIKDIKFVPEVSSGKDTLKSRRKSTKNLTEADKKHLSQMLEGVDDPEVRERLESMAKAFLQDQQN